MDKQKYQKELEVIDKAIDVCLYDRISTATATFGYLDRELNDVQSRLKEDGVNLSEEELNNLQDVFLEKKAEELKTLGSEIELPSSDTEFSISLDKNFRTFGLVIKTDRSDKIQAIYEEKYRYIKDTIVEWENEEDKTYSYKKVIYGKKNVGEVDIPNDEFLTYYEICKEFLDYSEKWKDCLGRLQEIKDKIREKLPDEFYRFILKMNTNDSNSLTDEVNKYTQSIYDRVMLDKEEFGKMAEKNQREYEINVVESGVFSEDYYVRITEFLQEGEEEKFKKFLLDYTFEKSKDDLYDFMTDYFYNQKSELNVDWAESYEDLDIDIYKTENGITFPISDALSIRCTLENYKQLARIDGFDELAKEVVELAWEGEKKEYKDEEYTLERLEALAGVNKHLSRYRANFQCYSELNYNVKELKELLVEEYISGMLELLEDAFLLYVEENKLYQNEFDGLVPLSEEDTLIYIDNKTQVYQEIVDNGGEINNMLASLHTLSMTVSSKFGREWYEKLSPNTHIILRYLSNEAIKSMQNMKNHQKLDIYSLNITTWYDSNLKTNCQSAIEFVENTKKVAKDLLSDDRAEKDGGVSEAVYDTVKKMEICLDEVKDLINKGISLTNEVIK